MDGDRDHRRPPRGYVLTWYAALQRAPATTVTSVLVVGAVITTGLQVITSGTAPTAPSLVGNVLLVGGCAAAIVAARMVLRPDARECGRRGAVVLDVIHTPSPDGVGDRLEPVSGALLFARFAAPPNSLGYCGGDDHRALVDHLRAGVDGPDLVRLCRAFEGAWPYLRLIATSAGSPTRSIPAWSRPTGSATACSTASRRRTSPRTSSAASVLERPARSGPGLLAKSVEGALPHHSFHVLEVMPRIGLLRAGHVAAILPSMEQCLIRPARVVASDDGGLLVRTRPLVDRRRSARLRAAGRTARRRRRSGGATRRRRSRSTGAGHAAGSRRGNGRSSSGSLRPRCSAPTRRSRQTLA